MILLQILMELVFGGGGLWVDFPLQILVTQKVDLYCVYGAKGFSLKPLMFYVTLVIRFQSTPITYLIQTCHTLGIIYLINPKAYNYRRAKRWIYLRGSHT